MNGQERREQGITKGEWFTLKTLSWMTIIVCILFPLISSYGVLPYLRITYGFTRDVIAQSNLIIMSLMVVLLVILPSRYGKGQPKRKVGALLAGVIVTIAAREIISFLWSFGTGTWKNGSAKRK